MKVNKLVFKEVEDTDYTNFISFIAESPIGAYYIDYDKRDKTYSSYNSNAEIGQDTSMEEAVKRVNSYHSANILACMK